MASRWILYKQEGTTLAFGELVALAREGEINEEDLVKADWEPEWRPAHTVVGLFYRVRRIQTESVAESPLTGAPLSDSLTSPETGFSFDDIAADLCLETAGASEQTPPADPRWMQRYREVTEQRAGEVALPLPDAMPGISSVRLLADEAVAAQERRTALQEQLHRWQGRWNRSREFAGSPVVFRVACAVFVAVLVSLSLATWSRQTAMRFPKPGMPDRYVVPGLGDCTPKEFGVVLVELALASAVAGYFGAKRIEGWADA
jgi:hypothetical protein